jgi:ABC-type branched-subunit amino acid transport system substrate-binding protein
MVTWFPLLLLAAVAVSTAAQLRIGAPASLSGPLAANGNSMARAVQLWQELVTEAG